MFGNSYYWTKNENYDIIIVEGTEYIGVYSFYGVQLKEIILPSTVVEIESVAFQNSTLESITIPASVKLISNDAFSGAHLVNVLVEKGSYAERFCAEHDLPFSYIDTPAVNPTLIPQAAYTPRPTPVPTPRPTRTPNSAATLMVTAAPAAANTAAPTRSAAQPEAVVAAAATQPPAAAAETPRAPASDAYRPVDGAPGLYQAVVECIEAPYLVGSKDPKAYITQKMMDGDENTSWQFSMKKNTLKNTYVQFYFSGPINLSAIWIKNGSWKADAKTNYYQANCRIRLMDVMFQYQNGQWSDRISVLLPDDPQKTDWLRINLGMQQDITAIQFCINEVYKGTKYDKDVWISELMFIWEP